MKAKWKATDGATANLDGLAGHQREHRSGRRVRSLESVARDEGHLHRVRHPDAGAAVPVGRRGGAAISLVKGVAALSEGKLLEGGTSLASAAGGALLMVPGGQLFGAALIIGSAIASAIWGDDPAADAEYAQEKNVKEFLIEAGLKPESADVPGGHRLAVRAEGRWRGGEDRAARHHQLGRAAPLQRPVHRWRWAVEPQGARWLRRSGRSLLGPHGAQGVLLLRVRPRAAALELQLSCDSLRAISAHGFEQLLQRHHGAHLPPAQPLERGLEHSVVGVEQRPPQDG